MTREPVKTKLCIHCEGRVPLDATDCPYCGAGLLQEPVSRLEVSHPHEDENPPAFDETLAYLYEPPYKGSVAQPDEARVIEEGPSIKAEEKYLLLPVLLFSIGVLMVALALLLVVVSSSRVLTLEFNSTFWPYYLLLGLPMACFGYKKL